MIITSDSIRKISGAYQPKAILVLVDEMSEVMSSSDFKLVNKIQQNLGSIARLGRAAACHLCLATQRPSSNVINADLKNNIQFSCLLGDFDTGASTLIFDEDISALSKPEIKGRGFLKTGKDIVEFQSYWTEKEKDFREKDPTTLPKGLKSHSEPETGTEGGATRDGHVVDVPEFKPTEREKKDPAKQDLSDRSEMMEAMRRARAEAGFGDAETPPVRRRAAAMEERAVGSPSTRSATGGPSSRPAMRKVESTTTPATTPTSSDKPFSRPLPVVEHRDEPPGAYSPELDPDAGKESVAGATKKVGMRLNRSKKVPTSFSVMSTSSVASGTTTPGGTAGSAHSTGLRLNKKKASQPTSNSTGSVTNTDDGPFNIVQ